ncbi:MAG: hypothetical protein KJ792_02705 [Actinobacteria bacterium]|nr:hypothetical protein [Actinomycetota bacterium]MCG2802927.1 hypothetical protein [Cellulomonas sp.]
MSNPYAPPDPTRPRPAPVRPAPGERSPVPQAPPPPAPDPAGLTRAARLVRTTLLLLLAGLVVTMLPTPWGLSAIGFAATAAVVGGRAVVVALRSHGGVQIVAPALMLTVSAVLGVAVGAASLYWLPVQTRYQECRESALTQAAQHACTAAYQTDISAVQTRLQNGG